MVKNLNNSERGSATVKLVVALVIIFMLIHAGYNYIPVAYEGESFKQEMQTAVVSGSMIQTASKSASDSVKEKLLRIIKTYELPNPLVEIKQVNNVVQARVAYSKDVKVLPFGLYNRTYKFDETVTPTGFLTKSF